MNLCNQKKESVNSERSQLRFLSMGKRVKKKKKMRKSNQCLRHVWHIIKHVNIRTVAVLEGEERGKGIKRFEK